jgi:sialic acid synthase SpsE
MERAKRMLTTVKNQGATRATLQVLTEPSKMTRNLDAVQFLKKNCMTLEQNIDVIKYGVALGLQMGVTLMEPEDIIPLLNAGVSFIKILSSDITYEPLLHAAGSAGISVYLSTGASEFTEIEYALQILRSNNSNVDVRLIHTCLVVPTPSNLLNLNLISVKKNTFGCPVAYGQHSNDRLAVLTAIAAGAESVFVYIAEERSQELPDGPHSILCSEAKVLMEESDHIFTMLGSIEKGLSTEEQDIKPKIRRSIVAAYPIKKGTVLKNEHLLCKRPGTGLQPRELPKIIGSIAINDFIENEDLVLN